jgi:hypothetical protein
VSGVLMTAALFGALEGWLGPQLLQETRESVKV